MRELSKETVSQGSTNLAGKLFGRLKAVCKTKQKTKKGFYWECLCNCGKTTHVRENHLVSGATRSCGCLHTESITKHGLHKTRTYTTWNAMKDRCLNKNNPRYADYGGRGIDVCQKWIESFEAFYLDMGERPEGKTIDRIDNNKGYSAENCKWSTPLEQMSNIRGKGYSWDKKNKKWRARIRLNGKSIWLGRFDTEKEASAAYKNAKKAFWDKYNNQKKEASQKS